MITFKSAKYQYKLLVMQWCFWGGWVILWNIYSVKNCVLSYCCVCDRQSAWWMKWEHQTFSLRELSWKHFQYQVKYEIWNMMLKIKLEVSCAVLCLVTQSCLILFDRMDCSPSGSSGHGILQTRILEWIAMPPHPPGDLPNLGIKPRFPILQVILYCLSHQGNPRILEWIAYPFSRVSSQPRNQTGVSCIASRCFTKLGGKPQKYHNETIRKETWKHVFLFIEVSLHIKTDFFCF